MSIYLNPIQQFVMKSLITLVTGLSLSTAAISATEDILHSHHWQRIAQDAYFSYAIDPQSVRESSLNSGNNAERIVDAPIKIVTLKDIPKYDYHKNEMAVQFNHYNCSTRQFSIGQIRSYTADGTLFDDDPSDTLEWINAESGSPGRAILDQICQP